MFLPAGLSWAGRSYEPGRSSLYHQDCVSGQSRTPGLWAARCGNTSWFAWSVCASVRPSPCHPNVALDCWQSPLLHLRPGSDLSYTHMQMWLLYIPLDLLRSHTNCVKEAWTYQSFYLLPERFDSPSVRFGLSCGSWDSGTLLSPW